MEVVMKITGLLGCNAMYSGRYLPTFHTNLLLHLQITMMKKPVGFPQNFGKYLPDYTALHPRIQ
jgi:hypothetical protein